MGSTPQKTEKAPRHDRPPNTFIEDNFDLKEYRESFITRLDAKHRRRTPIVTFFSTILSLAILAFILYNGMLIYKYASYALDNWQTKQIAEKTRQMNEANMAAQEAAAKQETGGASNSAPSDYNLDDAGNSSGQTPAVRPFYTELQKTFDNTDIVGYISIPGTSVDYPVVQAADNDYYMDKDLSRKQNVAGSIFMDYENSLYPLDHNTVLYGHNMKADTMFHDLRFYTDEAYYSAHNTVLFNTLYEDSEWEVFSFYETTTDFNYLTPFSKPSAGFEAFIRQIKEKSLFDSDVDVAADDKILTLSTCTNTEDNMRFVLHAKKISTSQ